MFSRIKVLFTIAILIFSGSVLFAQEEGGSSSSSSAPSQTEQKPAT